MSGHLREHPFLGRCLRSVATSLFARKLKLFCARPVGLLCVQDGSDFFEYSRTNCTVIEPLVVARPARQLYRFTLAEASGFARSNRQAPEVAFGYNPLLSRR